MMPYPPDYDRLLQEARVLAADETHAAKSLSVANMPPRYRVQVAASLLQLRSRLCAVLAGIADGQAGAVTAWDAGPMPPVAGHPALAGALASLEQRLTGLRRGGEAPY